MCVETGARGSLTLHHCVGCSRGPGSSQQQISLPLHVTLSWRSSLFLLGDSDSGHNNTTVCDKAGVTHRPRDFSRSHLLSGTLLGAPPASLRLPIPIAWGQLGTLQADRWPRAPSTQHPAPSTCRRQGQARGLQPREAREPSR